MAAATAFQLAAACVDITTAIINISKAVRNAQGLPPKLQAIFEQIPAIEGLLMTARKRCENQELTMEAQESAKPVFRQCQKALEGLKKLLEEACPDDEDNEGMRIWKGMRGFLSGNSELERQLSAIVDCMRLLEQKEIYDIGDKLDKLKQLLKDLANDEGSKYAIVGNDGMIFANEGGMNENYGSSGSGNRQINRPGNYYENFTIQSEPTKASIVRDWLKGEASAKSSVPLPHEDERVSGLVKSLYVTDSFKLCLQKKSHTLIVEGHAGSGKTTTLVMLAQRLNELWQSKLKRASSRCDFERPRFKHTLADERAARIRPIAALIEVNKPTALGESIFVVGSIPELGNWDCDKAIRLSTAQDDTYDRPLWSTTIYVSPGSSFEYKYLLYKQDGSFAWQEGPNSQYLAASKEVSTTHLVDGSNCPGSPHLAKSPVHNSPSSDMGGTDFATDVECSRSHHAWSLQDIQDEVAVICMHFDSSHPGDHVPNRVLMLLLLQLREQTPYFEEIENSLYDRQRTNAITQSDIGNAIIKMINRMESVCIFIDGLDECHGSIETRIGRTLDEIKRIQAKTSVGVVLSQRVTPGDSRGPCAMFDEASYFRLEADNSTTRHYVQLRLATFPGTYEWLKKDDLRDRIVDVMVRTCGSFLLLTKLNMDMLYSGFWIESDVSKLLDSLEEQKYQGADFDELLESAYKRSVARVTSQQTAKSNTWARQILSVIRDANRALSVSELKMFLTLLAGVDDLTDKNMLPWSAIHTICQGLVEHDDTHQVRFLHNTLGTYLRNRNSLVDDMCPDMNADLGRVCVNYLQRRSALGQCSDRSSLLTRLQELPLYEYAATNWGLHLRAAFSLLSSKPDHMEDHAYHSYLLAVSRFLKDDRAVQAAFQVACIPPHALPTREQQQLRETDFGRFMIRVYSLGAQQSPLASEDPYTPNKVTGLHVACLHELVPVIPKLMSVPQSIETRDCRERGALHFAAEGDAAGALRILLAAGADVNIEDERGVTPFLLACVLDRPISRKVLLDSGRVDVNAHSRHAVGAEHLVVPYLRLNEIDAEIPLLTAIKSFGNVGLRTPLHFAAREGLLETVDILLSLQDIHVSPRDTDGQTPFHKAAKKGHLDVVIRFLKDPRIDAAQIVIGSRGGTDDGSTALHIAASYPVRCADVAEHLITKYPDLVQMLDNDNESPLHCAMYAGSFKTAMLLLDKGADTGVVDRRGECALSLLVSSIRLTSGERYELFQKIWEHPKTRKGAVTPDGSMLDTHCQRIMHNWTEQSDPDPLNEPHRPKWKRTRASRKVYDMRYTELYNDRRQLSLPAFIVPSAWEPRPGGPIEHKDLRHPTRIVCKLPRQSAPVYLVTDMSDPAWETLVMDREWDASGIDYYHKAFYVKAAEYQYKIRLDSGWIIDHSKPVKFDGSGNENNVHTVQPPHFSRGSIF